MTDENLQDRVVRLAAAFGKALRSVLTEEEIDRVNSLNRSREDTCASHDFCDANIVMAEAFKQAEGRHLVICGAENGDAHHLEQEHLCLTNMAWSLAKAVGFEMNENLVRSTAMPLIEKFTVEPMAH